MIHRKKWTLANIVEIYPLNILKRSSLFYLIIKKIKWEYYNPIEIKKNKNIKLNSQQIEYWMTKIEKKSIKNN
jgi:hypothetical protein